MDSITCYETHPKCSYPLTDNTVHINMYFLSVHFKKSECKHYIVVSLIMRPNLM